ncbi:DUF2283 domain-containing protein [Actinosynnema sp. NPDC050436]|uniref:DUF2283 domain-containing protein n=1 Tax=Actinosynnema sp. NPDC050436 TaxID=3155659 RepID=UPI0033EAA7B0
MTELRVTYDREADAAYVHFTDPLTRPRSARTYACDPVAVDGMVNIDFDADGRIVGVEVLGARAKLAPYLLDAADQLGRAPEAES